MRMLLNHNNAGPRYCRDNLGSLVFVVEDRLVLNPVIDRRLGKIGQGDVYRWMRRLCSQRCQLGLPVPAETVCGGKISKSTSFGKVRRDGVMHLERITLPISFR